MAGECKSKSQSEMGIKDVCKGEMLCILYVCLFAYADGLWSIHSLISLSFPFFLFCMCVCVRLISAFVAPLNHSRYEENWEEKKKKQKTHI